ncbi:MAG: tRNA (adenosine(37)-N6)-dimethylallyltransferase MiaA [Bacteroidales bacterium]|nr:tRNA (adenosine(37)-N6)-dimethylallyltransferase MiaA [Bacteroidales bacterium]
MKRLIIIGGATAVGKTAFAISLAKQLNTEIISCDSRQFYSELNIGVARPSEEELAVVRHHFIACRSVMTPYNIYDYGEDAQTTIEQLFEKHETVVAVGGSGLYIDALRQTSVKIPNPSAELRTQLQQMPLSDKQQLLSELDPEYFKRVDRNNSARLQRALEVCLTVGQPYSTVIAEQKQTPRPYHTEIHIVSTDNYTLRQRINTRVDSMIAQGLVDEVASLLPMCHLNTLHTVGYTELFPVCEGKQSLALAVEQIKMNTWHYARKQLTWFRRYKDATVE